MSLRVLVLTPFLPWPPEDGGRQRMVELARRLARRNHVEVLSLCADGESAARAGADALAQAGLTTTVVGHGTALPRTAARAVARRRSLYGTRFASAAYAATLRRRLQAGDVDVVLCEYSFMAAYRPEGPRPEVWVLDEHNVEYRLNATLAAVETGPSPLYRAYARRESAKRRAEELRACRAADHVVAVSPLDAATLQADLPGLAVSVVANGVDVDRVRPADEDEAARPPEAVFVGKMDYRPNVDAVRWFAHEVLPLVRAAVPGFRFRIVGADPGSAVTALDGTDGIEVTGRVPDPRPHLARAALAVVPLRAGSGTRLKVLEAMAAGRPVVSTTLGAEGIGAEAGHDLVLADDAATFARRVQELLQDPERRAELGRHGRRLVEQRFSWDALAADLEALLQRLVEERGRP